MGTSYEQRAGAFLEEQGYQILEYNFRCRRGEIDVIAKDGQYLVFLEVKYRTNTQAGHPIEAVGWQKQRRISMSAAYYCMQHQIGDGIPCRFDVVAILGEEISVIKNAFEYQEH